MKKLWAYVLLLAVVLCFVPVGARASGQQKLCVKFFTDEYAITDASFSLYHIGDLSGNKVIPNSTFSAYSVDYNVSDAEKTKNLALTLSGYILRDDIIPDYTGKTDSKGETDFGEAYLPEGVYLIMADKHHQHDATYFCAPTLAFVPKGEDQSQEIIIKYESVPDDTQSVTVSYRVLKAWVEDDNILRPVHIEVQLLKDGEIYDTVILDESNNWSYQWNDLSVFYHWTVVEKWVSEGYRVLLSQEGKALLLTNSVEKQEEETTIPEESTTTLESTTAPDNTTSPDSTTSTIPDNTTSTDSTTSTIPDNTTSTNITTTQPDGGKTTTDKSQSTTGPSQDKDEPELPVTGTLQWPIPYLACIGLLLVILGYAKYRKSELKDE